MLAAMLPFAIAAVAGIVAFALYRGHSRRREDRQLAQQLLSSLHQNYPPEAEFRLLAPDELPTISIAPLEEAARAFAAAGFAPLGDVANLALVDADGAPIPMRVAVRAEEGLQACAYFHPAADQLFYDVSSDLSDGRTLTSSTALDSGKLEVPPEIERHYLPPGAPFDTVVRLQRDRLAELRRVTPGLAASAATTSELLLEDMRREARRKHAHRRELGWLTETELQRFTPAGVPPERMSTIHAEIRRLVAAEAA